MKKIAFKPYGEKILIKPLSKEQLSENYSLKPVSNHEKPWQGEVIAVGLTEKIPFSKLKEGDQVFYNNQSAMSISIGGSNYLIVNNADIYGVLNRFDKLDIGEGLSEADYYDS